MKFVLSVSSQTVIHYGYPIWIKIRFQTATLFHGKNIHLWYILLYQTSDNLQIIHVHVSHFVIYEKNIQITLRFVAKKKKKKKKKKKSKSAKLVFYSSQEKHICPVSLANSFSSQTKSSRSSFLSFRWSACFKCFQFSTILDKVVPLPHSY